MRRVRLFGMAYVCSPSFHDTSREQSNRLMSYAQESPVEACKLLLTLHKGLASLRIYECSDHHALRR